ncbi:hypothetical protein GCM10023149_27770 [Mucilaginibacter gynuensis]|uniref:Thiamine pyrophosphokinase n=1 Tax=Mucilaginibacter gynuensis TaxID=1302236 RepID=A0ABP8GJF1_9SPHI
MSSHHVVREKQEPALLVLGLDNFEDELLGQLLEWSPTLIVTPDTAEILNAQGIKYDWLIANQADADLQSDVKLMPAGDDSFALAAMKCLVAQGYPSVNIVTDELDLHSFEFFADKINLVIYHDHKKIYPVTTGFSKWKPAGEIIELLLQPHNVQHSGLSVLAKDRLQTLHDGFFSLQFDQPFIFIAEEI